MDDVRRAVAANVRTIRTARGLTLGALAEASGTGKATLSRIEAAQANPTVETLFALADALGVSFGALVAEPPQRVQHLRAADLPTVGGSVEARLLTQITGAPLIEAMDIHFSVGQRRDSGPHPHGVTEHLLLISGRVRVGPDDALVDLEEGDVLRFAADVPHSYATLGRRPARAVLLMTYPAIASAGAVSEQVPAAE